MESLLMQLEDIAENIDTPFVSVPTIGFKLPFKLMENVFLAGGAVKDILNNEPPKDYDVFGLSQEALVRFMLSLSSDWKLIHRSPHVSSYKNTEGAKLQVVTRESRIFPRIQDLLADFPFTINQFAYDGVCIIASRQGILDNRDKTVRTNRVTKDNCLQCIERINRYGQRGYTVTAESIRRVAEVIREADDADIKREADYLRRTGGLEY